MKIVVVSTGRSRCTLLAKYLHGLHEGLEFCGEYYNSKQRKLDEFAVTPASRVYTDKKIDLVESTNELFSKENYLVKLMALCLDYDNNQDASVFRLAEYDQIHFIERHDFFEQCCSWEVSLTERVFHLTNDTESERRYQNIRQRKYKMTASRINHAANFADLYLKLKKYVVDNNIPHSVHTYESAKMLDEKQDELINSNLNYSELITNYHQKEEVNKLFNQYFSYSDMTSDPAAFKAAIAELDGFRSIQSFANKMAAKWNK
jgi:glutaredoxin 2